ncbi:glycerophosphodiester phosphodiesterase [Halobaculum sp. MBLA0147]|uniref:glycerophosphodiester phosphodiesterase n=1 Tax=Halobaculum sp. MBLA0147 TaxID=3079934 RepID=UPI003523EC61
MSPSDSPAVIAHRGCPERHPENTRGAFRAAAAHADLIELDVRRCGSGELVVFHDDTLDRLLGVGGSVAETDLADLRSHSVLDSTERVPTLAEALAAIPADTGVNVELKETGIAADVAACCGDAGNEILVSSFSETALEEWRAVADDPIAYVTADDDWDAAVETATELGCDALHPQYDLVLGRESADDGNRGESADDGNRGESADDGGDGGTGGGGDGERAPRARVAAAHDADFAVNVWTIRSHDPVAPLCRAGVDGLIVDDWAYAEDRSR